MWLFVLISVCCGCDHASYTTHTYKVTVLSIAAITIIILGINVWADDAYDDDYDYI